MVQRYRNTSNLLSKLLANHLVHVIEILKYILIINLNLRNPIGTILVSQTMKNAMAPIVPQFSSRGPNPISPNVLKGYNTTAIRTITGNSIVCYKINPGKIWDLNYPSFALPIEDGGYIKGTFTRTITNVDSSNSTYYSTVSVPSILSVSVQPSVLHFSAVGEKKIFTVKVYGPKISQEPIISGSIKWKDGVHVGIPSEDSINIPLHSLNHNLGHLAHSYLITQPQGFQLPNYFYNYLFNNECTELNMGSANALIPVDVTTTGKEKGKGRKKRAPAKQRQNVQVPDDAEFLDKTDDAGFHWTDEDFTYLARVWVTASVQTTGHTKGFTFYQNLSIAINKDPECPIRRSCGSIKAQWYPLNAQYVIYKGIVAQVQFRYESRKIDKDQ
ncbi:hypothetical protein GIB67_019195, partial [Kingdonia uniflora]